MKNNIFANHEKEIAGTISVNDRIIIRGSLPGASYAGGMSNYLYFNGIRIFDYKKFASGLRDEYNDFVKKFSEENNVPLIPLNSYKISKEDKVKELIHTRGDCPGLICIISAVEGCPTFYSWRDKKSGKSYLRYRPGKCKHYYFYFIDKNLGLCYLRVATYAPFGVQFYCNGHNILAAKLDKAGIKYHMLDNCFDYIEDYEKAQFIGNDIDISMLKELLDYYVKTYCPVHRIFSSHLNWSVMQLEYSTDIVFQEQKALAAIYSDITKTAIHTVKVDKIATFLGKRFTAAFNEEAGSKYKVLIEGTCIKHILGKNSIKMYDKYGKVLRIETTSNDVSKFFIYRQVHHRDDTVEMKYASAPKNILYINDISKKMLKANERYIKFISAFEEHSVERKKLDKVTEKVVTNDRSYRGFNFFNKEDEELLKTIMLGEFNINGFKNKDIRRKFKNKNTGQISRIIKNLRIHGILKKVTNKYKYYVTENGKNILLAVFRMKELYLIPNLN